MDDAYNFPPTPRSPRTKIPGQTSFKTFTSQQRPRMAALYPFLTSQQINRKVSMMWAKLSSEEKKQYSIDFGSQCVTPKRMSKISVFCTPRLTSKMSRYKDSVSQKQTSPFSKSSFEFDSPKNQPKVGCGKTKKRLNLAPTKNTQSDSQQDSDSEVLELTSVTPSQVKTRHLNAGRKRTESEPSVPNTRSHLASPKPKVSKSNSKTGSGNRNKSHTQNPVAAYDPFDFDATDQDRLSLEDVGWTFRPKLGETTYTGRNFGMCKTTGVPEVIDKTPHSKPGILRKSQEKHKQKARVSFSATDLQSILTFREQSSQDSQENSSTLEVDQSKDRGKTKEKDSLTVLQCRTRSCGDKKAEMKKRTAFYDDLLGEEDYEIEEDSDLESPGVKLSKKGAVDDSRGSEKTNAKDRTCNAQHVSEGCDLKLKDPVARGGMIDKQDQKTDEVQKTSGLKRRSLRLRKRSKVSAEDISSDDLEVCSGKLGAGDASAISKSVEQNSKAGTLVKAQLSPQQGAWESATGTGDAGSQGSQDRDPKLSEDVDVEFKSPDSDTRQINAEKGEVEKATPQTSLKVNSTQNVELITPMTDQGLIKEITNQAQQAPKKRRSTSEEEQDGALEDGQVKTSEEGEEGGGRAEAGTAMRSLWQESQNSELSVLRGSERDDRNVHLDSGDEYMSEGFEIHTDGSQSCVSSQISGVMPAETYLTLNQKKKKPSSELSLSAGTSSSQSSISIRSESYESCFLDPLTALESSPPYVVDSVAEMKKASDLQVAQAVRRMQQIANASPAMDFCLSSPSLSGISELSSLISDTNAEFHEFHVEDEFQVATSISSTKPSESETIDVFKDDFLHPANVQPSTDDIFEVMPGKPTLDEDLCHMFEDLTPPESKKKSGRRLIASGKNEGDGEANDLFLDDKFFL